MDQQWGWTKMSPTSAIAYLFTCIRSADKERRHSLLSSHVTYKQLLVTVDCCFPKFRTILLSDMNIYILCQLIQSIVSQICWLKYCVIKMKLKRMLKGFFVKKINNGL